MPKWTKYWVGEFCLVYISQLDYHVVFQNKSGVIKDFHRGKTMLERDTTDPPFAPPPFLAVVVAS